MIDIHTACDLSLWLTPLDIELPIYERIVQKAAQKFNAYPFIPHVTLYYFGTSTVSEVVPCIDSVLTSAHKIRLPLLSVSHSTLFTKTLFISYEKTKDIDDMYQSLYIRCSSLYNYTVSPHMSLLYSNSASEELKEQFIKDIDLPREITLGTCMLIGKSHGIIQEEKDVLSWSVIKQWDLR
jgi:2'-5' RNA ligase